MELTDKERKHLYELSYNLPENITNKKKELLSQVANMELRDQLEAKEQMIKELKELLKRSCWYIQNGFIQSYEEEADRISLLAKIADLFKTENEE